MTLQEKILALPASLSITDKYLYVALHAFIEPGASIDVGEQGISQMLGIARKTVNDSKHALAEAGLITITFRGRTKPDLITLLEK